MSEFSLAQIEPAMPEVFLAAAGLVLLVLGVLRGRNAFCFISLAVSVVFFLTAILVLNGGVERTLGFNGMFVMDSFSGFMKVLIAVGLALSTILSIKYLIQENLNRFEYPLLVLFSGIGMLMMISAHDLLTAYMGLELQSLALYVLTAIRRGNDKSAEAGVKYFILGALASGFLLFGMSLIYGYTGGLRYDGIATALSQADSLSVGAVVGMVFIIVGVAFKLSAVPFHMWTPDVYEGAATSVTALLAMVPKIAAMGLLMRLLFEPFAPLIDQWQQIMWFLAMASMTGGAFAALAQKNIKRLLAYSSINHMGYATIGIVAGTAAGVSAVVLYMAIYMIMLAGVFAILLMMRRDGMQLRDINDMAGLVSYNPVLAYMMAALMFSMGAIPPLAGFFCKLFVFQAAVAQGMYVLAVVGVLTSVVAAFYYLRVIKVMFFDAPAEKLDQDFGFAHRIIALTSVLFLLLFITNPSALIHLSKAAAAALFAG